MSDGRRPQRLAEQIKEEVSLIIAGELEDPRVGLVTVSEVRLSPDLRYAKIYVGISGTEQEVKESLAALRHAAGFIRHELGSVLRMRRTPELHFVYDETDERAARIEELLIQEVKKASDRESPDEPGSDLPSVDR